MVVRFFMSTFFQLLKVPPPPHFFPRWKTFESNSFLNFQCQKTLKLPLFHHKKADLTPTVNTKKVVALIFKDTFKKQYKFIVLFCSGRGWSQTRYHPSWVLGLQACATKPSWKTDIMLILKTVTHIKQPNRDFKANF